MKKVVFVTSILLAVSMAMTACGSTAAKNNTMAKTAPLSGSVFNNTAANNEAEDAEAMLQSIIGTYSNGRAIMTVSPRGNDRAAISVTWGGSASESSAWMMGGTVQMDGDSIVVEYEDCVKTDMVATADGKIDEAVAYENGKGTLTFTNGNVTWKDLEEGASDGHIFEAYVEEDADAVIADDDQNPIMNFVGNYGNGRATMSVSARGDDKAAISVTWGSSAAASSSWMMTGTAVADGDKVVVDYEDCMKTDILFDENGVAEENTVYENGKGTLTFSGSKVVWDDQVENIADGAVFTYYSAD